MVSAFKQRYPKVRLTLKQGSPPQLAEMVLAGEADIAIATEALDQYPQAARAGRLPMAALRGRAAKHPLLKEARVTLEMLARYPIITYDPAFAGRSHIDEAFRAQGLAPDIVLSAVDSDVIKTYVELGLGIGIIAAVAFDEKRDRHLARGRGRAPVRDHDHAHRRAARQPRCAGSPTTSSSCSRRT